MSRLVPVETRARRRRPWYRRSRVARFVPVLLSIVLRLLVATLRIDVSDLEPIFARLRRGERVIVAFWHGRLLLMPAVARGFDVCILNSASRDGQIASRVIERWGIRTVSGSATRGGATGFLALLRAYRRGDSLAVVPDGPRGPAEQAKPGIIHLGRATGASIYPVSWAPARGWRLRSWDRMIVPRPFTRVVFRHGPPVPVPREASEAELEKLRATLEQRLREAGTTAEATVAS